MKDAANPLQQQDQQVRFRELLQANKLKVTQPRLRVLEIITNKKSAISQPELEKLIGQETDRVTLYRILSSFEEKGILHKVFDLNGTATYATCSSHCSEHQHQDQHVHFICSACNSVICLDEIALPKINIPQNFALQSIAINAIGLCENCQK